MPRKPTYRRTLFPLLILMLLFPGGGKATAQPPRSSPDLLKRAVGMQIRVADEMQDETYFCLSEQKFLFLRPNPSRRHFHSLIIDAQTGSKELLTKLNEYASPSMPLVETMTVGYQNSKRIDHIYAPPRCALSPDRQWLLWQTRQNPPVWHTARLDGTQKFQGKSARNADYVGWTLDGRHWIELVRSDDYSGAYTKLVWHELGLPKSREISLRGIRDGIVLGFTGTNSLLVYHIMRSFNTKRQANLTELTFDEKRGHPRRFTVPLPATAVGAEIVEVVLSPKGDKLAWLLTDKTPLSEKGEVWVSDAAGRNMRRMGRLGEDSIWRRALQWLPDGRQLSFRHRGYLWKVEVD